MKVPSDKNLVLQQINARNIMFISSVGSRNSQKGMRNRGLGTEVPQLGPGAESRCGSGGEAWSGTFTTDNKRKLQYKDIYNTTKIGQT